jgi:hypothetical protein
MFLSTKYNLYLIGLFYSGCNRVIRQFLAHQKSPTSNFGPHGIDTHAQIVLCDYAVHHLTNLLSPVNLATDLTLLPAVDIPNSKTYLATAEIVAMILQQRIHCREIDRLSNDTFNDTGATTIFSHILSTAAVLDAFTANYADIQLTKRFMSWEIAQSLSIISRWYTDTGPMLAGLLFGAHKQDAEQDLQMHFPSFAELVNRIMLYVRALHNSKPSKSARKHPVSVQASVVPSIEELRCVSMTVFGSQFSSAVTFHLPYIEPHLVGPSTDSQYTFGQQCFIQVISDVFIAPRLVSIDAHLNGPGRNGANASQSPKLNVLQGCVKRTIIHGAVIDAIVEACGGDDGILSCSAIDGVLRSPAFLFDTSPGHHTNDDVVVKKLLRSPATILAPLQKWLGEFVATSSTEILPCVKKLGDAVYSLICQRHGSRPFPRFNPLQAIAKAKPRHGKPFGTRPTNTTSSELSELPLMLESLMKHPDGDSFSQLAVIIREALNRRRSLPDGDPHIARIMQGLHPTTGLGTEDGDLDHFDPIRLDNVYSRMLKAHFTLDRLLGVFGLTNLLIWMSTGQGFLTQEFCTRTLLWFTNQESCIQTFRDALFGDGQTKFCNTRIWGTTCASFSVQTVKFTIEEKFSPFFSDAVLTAWKTFLGDLFESGKIPDDQESLLSFTAALTLLEKLMAEMKLNGFKTGLTKLQFANNLVSLGLCRPPTVGEIAAWIHKNPEKGAFKGLVALGFNIEGRPEHWTKAAFQVVLDHLSSTLCLEDQDLLIFGTIFLEHILCKVSRFAYLIRSAQGRKKKLQSAEGEAITGGLSLKQIGAQAADVCTTWVQGANLADCTGKILPIPVKGDIATLQASVKLWI